MLHDYETIVRKVRMGGQVLPSETVLVIREILNRLEGLQEKFDGLETSINNRQGSCSVPKKKVSKSQVRCKSNE